MSQSPSSKLTQDEDTESLALPGAFDPVRPRTPTIPPSPGGTIRPPPLPPRSSIGARPLPALPRLQPPALPPRPTTPNHPPRPPSPPPRLVVPVPVTTEATNILAPLDEPTTDADDAAEEELDDEPDETDTDPIEELMKVDLPPPPPTTDRPPAPDYESSNRAAAAAEEIVKRRVPSPRPAAPPPAQPPLRPESRRSHRGDPEERGGREINSKYPWETEHGKRYPFKDLNKATEIEYPPDRYGEEASENARVWKLYRNRASELDNDQIEGWNKTLDILLIFAGLFSAVATAFVIEAYKNLKPDYSEVMAKAFIASLTADGNTTALQQSIAQITHFERPGLARYVNLLWFFSLTLALVVALLAILAKQWLSEYTSRMRAHSASQRRWAWRHVVFNAGLKKWGMDAFISALPLMMHGSLFLFLLGLVAFLTELDWATTAIVLMVTVGVLAFYTGATIMPLWYGDCPTTTPLLRKCRHWLEQLIRFFRGKAANAAAKWERAAFDEDRILADGKPGHRDAIVLRWMLTSLPAVDEADITLDAIGALDPLADYPDGMLNDDVVRSAATTRFNRLAATGAAVDPEAAGHCLRTLLFVGVDKEWKADQTIRPWEAGYRWRDILTHDLHILCDVVLFPNGWTRKTMEFISTWTNDTAINAGQSLPLLPSTLSLIFLRANIVPGEIANVATTYCDLLEPLSSPARDFDQRRTAFILLDSCMAADGVALYDSSSLEKLRNTAARVSRAEQIHLQALRTLGHLINYPKPNIVHADVRKRAAAILTATVSRSRPVATPSDAQHEEMARLLDVMASPGFESAGVHPAPILRFVQQYLIQARSNWSESHGQIAHRSLHLGSKTSPPRTARTADDLASGLAGIPRCGDAAELVASSWTSALAAGQHSRINILIPQQQGEDTASTWKLLCGPDEGGRASVDLLWLALDLISHLTILSRNGLDVTDHVKELLGDTLGFRLMRLQMDLGVTLALHARELWPEWWDKTKEELQEIPADDWTVSESNPHKTVEEFVKAVEEHPRCTNCPDRIDFLQEVVAPTPEEELAANNAQIATFSSRRTISFWGTSRSRTSSQRDLSAHEDHELEPLQAAVGADAV